MRRLAPRQFVTLDLDDGDEGIECQVRSVAGPVAMLDCVGEIAPETRARLTAGSFCFMAFTYRGALVGLRGIATPASDDLRELAFVIADRVQVEERRSAERLALVTRTRICAVNNDGIADPSIETFTNDISLGGARIERHPGLGEGPQFRLELFFGRDPAPVCCEAQIARQTSTHFSLRFTDMEPLHHARLAAILAGYQLRSAPRA